MSSDPVSGTTKFTVVEEDASLIHTNVPLPTTNSEHGEVDKSHIISDLS